MAGGVVGGKTYKARGKEKSSGADRVKAVRNDTQSRRGIRNVPLENRVIRTAVRYPELRSVVLQLCRSETFGYPSAKEVFERMGSLLYQGIELTVDGLSIDQFLTQDARDLASSGGDVFTRADDLKVAIGELDLLRKRRIILAQAEKALDGLESDRHPDEIIAESDELLIGAKVADSADTIFLLGEGSTGHDQSAMGMVADVLDRTPPKGIIPTGFDAFDSRSGGFSKGDLAVLMAPRASGKSSMALSMAVDMYKRGYTVVYVSIELSKTQFMQRLVSCVSGVAHGKIRQKKLTTKERIKAHGAMMWFDRLGQKNGNRFIPWISNNIGADDLSATLPTLGADVVVIDYLTFMRPPPGIPAHDKVEVLDANALAAKRIATNERHPMLVVSIGHMTNDFQFKYSRAVENHADFIWAWFLRRRDRALKVCRVRQTKCRDAEEFDFTVGVNIDCHQWYDINPEDDPYAEEEDFEPTEAAEYEHGAPVKRRGSGGPKRPKQADEDKFEPGADALTATELEGFASF